MLLLGTGLVVYLRRRKSQVKQLPSMPHGCLLPREVLPVGGAGSAGSAGQSSEKRMTMSLKQLKLSAAGGSTIAPCRDGFYGPVAESDSDTCSFYHEPYQRQVR